MAGIWINSDEAVMKIKQRIRIATNILLGKERSSRPAGRKVTVFPDDVFITSYPKSGNTWVRFLVGNLVWGDKGIIDFSNIGERVPSIYGDSNAYLETVPRPRILKSHECFDPRYPKVLYIVRDARAVLVSYYHFQMRMQKVKPEMSLSEFAKVFLYGNGDEFRTWRENILSWIRLRGDDQERFCLIRYEDLKLNGKEVLKKIASFFQINCSESQIENALKMSAFNRMRLLEKRDFEKNPEVPAGRAQNMNIPVVRSGQISEWKQVLDKDALELIKEHCIDLLKELGYEW